MPDLGPVTYYKDFAKELLFDIALLNDDIDYVLKGGNVLTACDFSEIYAYSKSVSDTFLSRLGETVILDDQLDKRTMLNQLHDHIMLFFLFEAKQPLWLLDPYLIELQRFRAELRANLYGARFTKGGQALREIAEAVKSPLFKEIQDIAKTFTQTNAIDDEQARRVLEFLQEVAPALVEVVKDQSGQVGDRLSRLLQDGTLVIPSDVPMEAKNGDEETFGRWYDALTRRRPKSDRQNVADAKAMANLFSINKWLNEGERPQRLNLLTRSDFMHAIMRAPAETKYWEEIGGNPLRHPRGMLALLDEAAGIVSIKNPQRQRQTLSRWTRIFEQIVDSGSASRSGLTEREIFKRHVAVIANVWERYCRTRAAAIVMENDLFASNANLKVIAAVADHDAVKRMVVEQLHELDNELGGTHFVLAAMMSPELKGLTKFVADTVEVAPPSTEAWVEQRGKLVKIATPHGSPMPFRVGFRTPKFPNAFKSDGQDPWSAFSVVAQANMMQDILEAGRKRFDPEWYLASGYVCAALGAWSRTKQATDFARGMGLDGDLELELLAARATRHVSQSIGDLLDTRTRLKRLPPKGKGDLDEARLTSELLKYEFILCKRAVDARQSPLVEAQRKLLLPMLQSGAEISARVKSSPERSELLNNMVYHAARMALTDRPVWQWSEIVPFFLEMKKEFAAVYGEDIDQWPANLLDTYSWVRLKLLQNNLLHLRGAIWDDAFERQQILAPLLVVSEYEYVSEFDKQDFRLHANDAVKFFDRKNQ